MLCNLEKRDTQGPDIRCDGVGLSLDSFWSHVVGCAYKSIRIAFGTKLAGHAKITELHLTITAEKDIRGFNVCEMLALFGSWKTEQLTSVDDLPAVQISKTMKNSFGYSPKDFLARPSTKLLHLSVNTI